MTTERKLFLPVSHRETLPLTGAVDMSAPRWTLRKRSAEFGNPKLYTNSGRPNAPTASTMVWDLS